jgi:Crp-like helix-turn-helix domain
MCELLVWLRAVEPVENHAFPLPITQAELGDALGISTVHVNRVLQELRGKDLILLNGGSLKVLDWDRLKKVGEFPSLHCLACPKNKPPLQERLEEPALS